MEAPTPDSIRAAAFAAFRTFTKEKRELETYVIIGQSLIEACLSLAEKHPDKAVDYKSVALPTSYNIAAACWPGWEDAAQDIPAETLETALELCRFNVALGEELDIPPERRFNGQWILGAHLLAQAAVEEAKECFANCEALGQSSEAKTMAKGWGLVCDILAGDSSARSELESLGEQLSAMGEDGEFFAGQYEPAIKRFS